MSYLSGILGANLGGRFGRGYLLGLGFGGDLVLMTALLLWRPYPTSLVPFFWVSMLYGTSDAIFQTQLYTMYGVIFNNCTDSAFANFRFWEALGFCISYGYQSFLPTNIKCYIMLGVILCGAAGYTTCEWIVSKEQEKAARAEEEIKINGKVFREKFEDEVPKSVNAQKLRGQSFLSHRTPNRSRAPTDVVAKNNESFE